MQEIRLTCISLSIWIEINELSAYQHAAIRNSADVGYDFFGHFAPGFWTLGRRWIVNCVTIQFPPSDSRPDLHLCWTESLPGFIPSCSTWVDQITDPNFRQKYKTIKSTAVLEERRSDLASATVFFIRVWYVPPHGWSVRWSMLINWIESHSKGRSRSLWRGMAILY
jgi:hypothetical protein